MRHGGYFLLSFYVPTLLLHVSGFVTSIEMECVKLWKVL